jgi:hypothetical protein
MTHKPRRSSLFWWAIALGSSALIPLVAHFNPTPAAQAQERITDEDVTNYANAVVAIEPLRLAAYESASDILAAAGSEQDILESPMSCLATQMSDMPDVAKDSQTSLREVLVNFCNEASQLAEDNNLTPQRFNAITEDHRANDETLKRIQDAIAEL